MNDSQSDEDCVICQQKMLFPIKLHCHHTFCFMCMKSLTIRDPTATCPMCRAPIDHSLLVNPQVRRENGVSLNMIDPSSPLAKRMRLSAGRARAGAGAASSSRAAGTAQVKIESDEEDVKPVIPYFWLYEGKASHWWRFDPRQEKDLETGFAAKANNKTMDMVICGTTYVIDFENNYQYRRDVIHNGTAPDKYKRKIKRVNETDFNRTNVIGIAGVRIVP